MFHKKIVWHNVMVKCYEEEVPNRIVGWKIIQYSEIQRNSHDCGLFVIMYFFYITRQAHLDFSTCDMPLIRQWLAALLVARSYEGMRPYLGWLLPKIAENKYKIGSLHLKDVPCPSELIRPSTPQPHIPSDPMEPPCFKTNKKVHLPSIQAPVTSNVMEPCSKICPGPPSSPPAHVHHVPLSEASECIQHEGNYNYEVDPQLFKQFLVEKHDEIVQFISDVHVDPKSSNPISSMIDNSELLSLMSYENTHDIMFEYFSENNEIRLFKLQKVCA